MASLIPAVRGFAYGGDYTPEQWPEDTWRADAELMKLAGVNLVTVGVFGWALLEPAPGRYEFGWLDRVLDLMAAHGIAVDLATATASPPPWFSTAHPESLPVTRDGRTLWHGSRQTYCPSSPAYRDATAALVSHLASRYAGHPALAMWHINNEYGCHVSRCWCDTSARAFRDWLRERYGDLDALNEAWGTAFWSQHYTGWDQVIPPRDMPSFPNPGHQLDFYRFSSAELLACLRTEREVLRRLSPGTPVTTNFLGGLYDVDYWELARELDVISMDHYLIGTDADPHAGLALTADLARSLAGGGPWVLMEHSTSAVSWQPRNLAKPPGQLRRDSLAHVARGADAVLYFQWRASRAGAEKWHSGMVPHGGTDTKVWREVQALGDELAQLTEVQGSDVVADAAIVLDWSSVWAQQHPNLPSVDLDPLAVTAAWHAALRANGITCDFVHPEAGYDRYPLVLVPALYLVTDAGAAALARYVENGGTAVVGPFSGIVDEQDRVRLGGYPGAWRDLLGIRVEEHYPLPEGGTVALDDGGSGRLWTELSTVTTAETLVRYAGGPLAGGAALTRNSFGTGTAYYLTTHPAGDSLTVLLGRLADAAGVRPPVAEVPAGVEVVARRHADGRRYVFLANDGESDVDIALPGDILSGGTQVPGPRVRVPAGGMAVVRQAPGS
ncbi:MAG TPA: beta-galactosidase [Rugosimonospora sp.]|nr:beta-galactosidase [Rugosimonospora sp.]